MNDIFSASIHAVILSFGLIAPLGVQNIYIFNQGARQPTYIAALPSIITAAICDSILICLASFGLSLLIFEIAPLKLTIFIVGFIFLLYMGYQTWNSAPIDFSTNSLSYSFKKQILISASLSLFNPHAIIDTIIVIGTSALKYQGKAKIAFTISCVLVSWIWFFFIAFLGSNIKRLNKGALILKVLNKVAAIIIWIIALYLGVEIINEF